MNPVKITVTNFNYQISKAKGKFKEIFTVVGDGLIPVWIGDEAITDALDGIKPAADEVLAGNQ